jgi:hypothetical protein
MKTTNRERLASLFYWLGVAATLASIALVLLGNTKWGAQVQHTSFPLAWKFAGAAILSFLVGEICHPAFPFRPESQKQDSRQALEHTPYEI